MAPDNQRPAESTPEPTLLALARKKFGALSSAEEELFRATEEGREASVLTSNEQEDDPANAANWSADRAVRAKCLSWVCSDKQASALVTHRGLDLNGMRIVGSLDLDNAEVRFRFVAWKCVFSEHISMQDAQLRGLYLLACRIKSLNANRAIVNGPVLMRNGFKAEGEVNLAGAKIGGVLDCYGAQFSNANGLALIADGAKIEGSVFLRDGCKAEGEINLVAIEIGGNLECDGAEFSNAQGLALNANGAKIEGDVYLRKHFKADGEVSLASAKIRRHLDCSVARFSNAKGLALTANAAKIESCVFLSSGFKAEGEVNLVGSTIGGLEIFDILGADQMILDLRLTQVGSFRDDEKSWPKAGNLFLDGFRYEWLYEAAPFEAGKRKKWLSLQRRDRFRPQPYEQLAAVLRRMGHESEARRVTIEKNRERARFTDFPHQSWWWYNLFGRLIGYGYAPWRAFALSLAMIVLGTVLFHFGSKQGLMSPTSENAYAKAPAGQVIEENGRKKMSEQYPVFNAFVYSLESFVPLLKLDQSANWRPNANHGAKVSLLPFWSPRVGSLLRGYLYFHIASGWLLTSLWVGAITGLVKT